MRTAQASSLGPSGQPVALDVAEDVGQAHVPAIKPHGQARVIEAEGVQERGVQVMHLHRLVHGEVAEVIGGAEAVPALEPAAGKPDGEPVRVVVAAFATLGRWQLQLASVRSFLPSFRYIIVR